MRIDLRDPQPVATTTGSPNVNGSAGPTLLTLAELDHVTAAGSKPGMVGDGRQASQSAAAR